MFIKQIDELIDQYSKFGVFNEEVIIKNKIQYYLRKGYSLNKVKNYLIKNKFNEELINKELKILDSDNVLKKALIERFIEKKIKLSRYKNGKLTNSQIFDKLIKSLVQNGFDYEFSKNILHRYLSKC